jgi:hypothetical protein
LAADGEGVGVEELRPHAMLAVPLDRPVNDGGRRSMVERWKGDNGAVKSVTQLCWPSTRAEKCYWRTRVFRWT